MALLARGFNTRSIEIVGSQGLSLKDLKLLTKEALFALGLDPSEVESVQDGSRPPIPRANLLRVLNESKWTCCVCRRTAIPIVVHHIIQWAQTKDHSEENLVLVCVEHHDEAHSKRSLSLTMSPTRLRDQKSQWLELARTMDARAILGLANAEGARWDGSVRTQFPWRVASSETRRGAVNVLSILSV